MPKVTSKAEYKFMQAIAHGWKSPIGGPSKKQAAKMAKETKSPGKLPARARKK